LPPKPIALDPLFDLPLKKKNEKKCGALCGALPKKKKKSFFEKEL